MQLSLLFDTAQTPRAYTAADSRKAGEIAGQRAADCAERDADGFRARAQAFVLGYLAQHGVSSGELVTQACKLAGSKAPAWRLGYVGNTVDPSPAAAL